MHCSVFIKKRQFYHFAENRQNIIQNLNSKIKVICRALINQSNFIETKSFLTGNVLVYKKTYTRFYRSQSISGLCPRQYILLAVARLPYSKSYHTWWRCLNLIIEFISNISYDSYELHCNCRALGSSIPYRTINFTDFTAN